MDSSTSTPYQVSLIGIHGVRGLEVGQEVALAEGGALVAVVVALGQGRGIAIVGGRHGRRLRAH
jgi:hypothetical protein